MPTRAECEALDAGESPCRRAPLYLRFVDMFDAVEVLREVMADQSWDRPELKGRAAVT